MVTRLCRDMIVTKLVIPAKLTGAKGLLVIRVFVRCIISVCETMETLLSLRVQKGT